MKTMPSSEFRKTYARLNEAVKVTVSGHVIGTWFPGAIPMKDEIAKIVKEAGFGPVPESVTIAYTPQPYSQVPIEDIEDGGTWPLNGEVIDETGKPITIQQYADRHGGVVGLVPNLGWDPLADLPARPFRPAPKPGKGK